MLVRRHHDQLISRTTEPLCPSPKAQRAGHSKEGSVVPEVAVPDVNSPEVTCGELEPPTTPEHPSLVPATPVRRYPVRDRRLLMDPSCPHEHLVQGEIPHIV